MSIRATGRKLHSPSRGRTTDNELAGADPLDAWLALVGTKRQAEAAEFGLDDDSPSWHYSCRLKATDAGDDAACAMVEASHEADTLCPGMRSPAPGLRPFRGRAAEPRVTNACGQLTRRIRTRR